MPKRDGKTRSISTEWVVEVFGWDSDEPSMTGGVPTSDDVGLGRFAATKVGSLGSPGPSTTYAYVNKDILTSLKPDASSLLRNITSLVGEKKNDGISFIKDVCDGNVCQGVVSISYRREKKSADQRCEIVVVGPLPKHTRAGSWVIVSIPVTKGNALDLVPKFIGQIQKVSTDYSVLQNGAVVVRSNVSVASWSNLLMSPVLLDVRSCANLMKSPMVAVTGLFQDLQSSQPAVDLEDIRNAAVTPANPYQNVQTFVQLIGLANSSAYGGSNLSDVFKVSASMPEMPKAFLERLNFYGESNTAFANGLVSVVTGRVDEPSAINLTSNWDGFFEENAESSAPDFDTFVSYYNDFANQPDLQPYHEHMSTVAQLNGSSIWSMITDSCDPQFNEVFTDIFYEIMENGFVVPRLALFVRGKPFKTKEAEALYLSQTELDPQINEKPVSGSAPIQPEQSFDINNLVSSAISGAGNVASGVLKSGILKSVTSSSSAIYDSWNYYEKVPRIQLDSTLITGIKLTNTFMTSPTLFNIGYHGAPDSIISKFSTEYASLYNMRHDAEMLRFGSNYRKILTQYFFLDNSEASGADWFASAADLTRVWDGCNYRTASGTINIKDTGLPLSIGFNLQFNINNTDFVVHIEAVETNFIVTPDGNKSTTTSIQFSRMMRVSKQDPEALEFCPAATWGDIWGDAPPSK